MKGKVQFRNEHNNNLKGFAISNILHDCITPFG